VCQNHMVGRHVFEHQPTLLLAILPLLALLQ
jgi:hypothetical protein